jgi:hypothetical protein
MGRGGVKGAATACLEAFLCEGDGVMAAAPCSSSAPRYNRNRLYYTRSAKSCSPSTSSSCLKHDGKMGK